MSAPPDLPGWVPSPGQWTPPEEARAGKDWVPPGGATERLDRMPWWVRAWSRPPLRALGRFEEWLWKHGGYDVETPGTAAQRERLTARDEALEAALQAALDEDGPWPARTTVRTQDVEVVDVDRYGDLALVTAAIEDGGGDDGPLLMENLFHREEGIWRSLGGSGSGSGSDPLLARREWREPQQSLRLSGPGRHSPGGKRGSKDFCHATLNCSPAVSSVIVERPGNRREADVSEGAGWIGIVWPAGSEPKVTALDTAGDQIGVLGQGEFRHCTVRHRGLFGTEAAGRLRELPSRWRQGPRSGGWFNYRSRPRQ